MMDPSSCDIESLIPHRAPMRIVERVCAADDSSIETVSTVRETWPTLEAGHVGGLMLVELIAQSAAALAGWIDREEGGGTKPGYLVGVPRAEICRPRVRVGTVLRCHARITQAIDNYRAFEGRVTDDAGAQLVTATIQAIRPDEES
jgi:predicted hotdog family 3-hydroxylacyl-ACP dehydratase